MYQTEEFVHLPVTFLWSISPLKSPKEELQTPKIPNFTVRSWLSKQQSDDMRVESKYRFCPDCGYLLHFGHLHSHVTQTAKSTTQHPDLHSVASGGMFNRKRMKISLGNGFSRSVLLQVFIRTSCDIGIHFRNL